LYEPIHQQEEQVEICQIAKRGMNNQLVNKSLEKVDIYGGDAPGIPPGPGGGGGGPVE